MRCDCLEPGHKLSVFDIPKMDCAAEERVIRMALDSLPGVKKLSFDLASRQMNAIHTGPESALLSRLAGLNLGAKLSKSSRLTEEETISAIGSLFETADESRVLKYLLVINAVMFIVEIVLGWIAESTGLIADSMDMFADAAVYGLSLYAVGRSSNLKHRAAVLTGYIQILLAVGAFGEVGRRLVFGSDPESSLMIGVAVLALIANIGCMALLAKHRTGGVHMRATWICSQTDVIANFGVIVAGLLVAATSSSIPDLVIGTLIAGIVLSGAVRILRMTQANLPQIGP